MNDQQLMRYARNILLEEYGFEKQKIVMNSHVLIVGLGGLGSSAAMYLASCGIGKLTLIDKDEVDISNLQRQIIHNTNNIGMSKVLSAQKTLSSLNPEVSVSAICQEANEDVLNKIIMDVDLVLDCSDNFTTRYLINRMCVEASKSLVSGAAIRFNGQVSVYDLKQIDSPCYNCLFPYEKNDLLESENCATTGVFSPLVGVIGSMQASESLKILANIGKTLVGRLVRFDLLNTDFKVSYFNRDSSCEVCSYRHK
ncbi:family 2 dinucleotide-utilizing molybdopterin and thiamine biosynthesis protein [Candidatus Kinetoplastibacterium desouzaii TCC079E]|uniref:Molybdopterin-synthase adenylyltransferase n=1 Tax=Candidatus Kinetoplastidibacterium desouzai TCC079E TaxID=1208919 RepID=M1LN95_9PROT|nr:HesA/MoeB/ThiF family protein [Candidatus Kinetoplastibacterium desouzaii]AGF47182.1 family 2 dinucleotide-utilizing molybdopterin and thiamine biosynthesis protein [Candidatus Kinetoplastibacterium desouzaii TCC079E]